MKSIVVVVVVSFVLFVWKIHGSVAAPVATTYDQQQTGDLNVQVHLEDIQIVALLNSGLLGDYGEYDYAYDYSDFTLKPITSHTTTTTTESSAPGSVTTSSKSSVEPWYTWPTISPSSSTAQSTTLQSDLAAGAVASSTPKSEEQNVDINYNLKKKYDSSESSIATRISSSSAATDRSPAVTTAKDVDLELTTELTQEESDWDKLFAGVEGVLAAEKLDSSLSSSSSSASSSETAAQELSEALLEQPQQQQTLKKCVPGQGQDQKQRRCVRRHLRRRVPSPLLPFGIRLTPRINRRRDELPSDP